MCQCGSRTAPGASTDLEIVSPVALVVSAARPGSVLGRAFAAATRELSLDQLPTSAHSGPAVGVAGPAAVPGG